MNLLIEEPHRHRIADCRREKKATSDPAHKKTTQCLFLFSEEREG